MTLDATHHIAGVATASKAGQEAESINPATGRPVGTFADGGAAEAEAAITAARAAADSTEWAHQPRGRAGLLLAMADAIEDRSADLAGLLAREVGIPISDARHEVRAAHGELRYYAGLARAIFGRLQEIDRGLYSAITKEPFGVVGIIVPWNAPLTLLVRSLAPALAAGCTAVVKAPGRAALVSGLAASLLTGVDDLPPGVVNVFLESGSDGAAALVSSDRVDVVSYTGGTAVGREIMRSAAETVKPLSLELGGSAPVVIFDDADVGEVATAIARSGTVRSGQHCTAANRVIAHESIAEEAASALTEALLSIRMGDPLEPATQMGPLVDVASRDRIEGLVAAAAETDDVLLHGSRADGDLAAGAYISPSLVAVRSPDSPMLGQEVFGPALSIDRFSDEDEAIRKANDTIFGLSASVWGADFRRCLRAAERIKAGTVWINGHNRLMAEAETGGYRQSGIGRLHGIGGLETFLQTKTISYTLRD